MTSYTITAITPKSFRRAVIAMAAADLDADIARNDVIMDTDGSYRHTFWSGNGRQLGYEARRTARGNTHLVRVVDIPGLRPAARQIKTVTPMAELRERARMQRLTRDSGNHPFAWALV